MFCNSLRTGVVVAVLVTANYVGAQAPDEPSTVGQQKMRTLAFMIGDWDVTENAGTTKTMSIRWINNNSFIELVLGDYREIIGWDSEEEGFVSQAFDGNGGHARYLWTKSPGDVWHQEARPAYYAGDGTKQSF